MAFGEDWGWGAAKDEAQKAYDAFREAGGNFMDTANVYKKAIDLVSVLRAARLLTQVKLRSVEAGEMPVNRQSLNAAEG